MFIRGSSASRSPSPRKLKLVTASVTWPAWDGRRQMQDGETDSRDDHFSVSKFFDQKFIMTKYICQSHC
jgi:hypothetical protein